MVEGAAEAAESLSLSRGEPLKMFRKWAPCMGMRRHDRMPQVQGGRPPAIGLQEEGKAGQRFGIPKIQHKKSYDTIEMGRSYSDKGRNTETTWAHMG